MEASTDAYEQFNCRITIFKKTWYIDKICSSNFTECSNINYALKKINPKLSMNSEVSQKENFAYKLLKYNSDKWSANKKVIKCWVYFLARNTPIWSIFYIYSTTYF